MMGPTNYFPTPTVFSSSWADYFTLAVIGIALVLGVLLFIERPKHAPNVHSPRMAWLRAGLYFCFVIVFGWATGALQKVAYAPIATREQLADPLWIGLTLLCFAVVAWGYLFWWPRGTLTHGRKLHVLPSLGFGVAWGLSAGVFLLSVFAVLEEFQFPRLVTAALLLLIITVYNLNYQSGWWDIHVSPPHNVRAWNVRKVLFAHNPFLLVSLSYFFIYGNASIYVVLNACALGASTVAMRFPPFWAPDGGPVSLETAIGE